MFRDLNDNLLSPVMAESGYVSAYPLMILLFRIR